MQNKKAQNCRTVPSGKPTSIVHTKTCTDCTRKTEAFISFGGQRTFLSGSSRRSLPRTEPFTCPNRENQGGIRGHAPFLCPSLSAFCERSQGGTTSPARHPCLPNTHRRAHSRVNITSCPPFPSQAAGNAAPATVAPKNQKKSSRNRGWAQSCIRGELMDLLNPLLPPRGAKPSQLDASTRQISSRYLRWSAIGKWSTMYSATLR